MEDSYDMEEDSHDMEHSHDKGENPHDKEDSHDIGRTHMTWGGLT